MREINFFNFAVYILIVSVALFLQSWLALALINARNGRLVIAWIGLFLSIFLGYLWAPFFWEQLALLTLIIAPIIFLQKNLTGNLYVDFLICFFTTTFLFYFLNNNFSFDYSLFSLILKEIAYGIFISPFLILLLNYER